MDTILINKTHILALKEVNNSLQSIQINIEKPEQFIAELHGMLDNPNRTVWDMQSCFKKQFAIGPGFHDYLHPYSYSASYVGGIAYPANYEYDKLKLSWEQAAKSAKDEYVERCRQFKVTVQISEIEVAQNAAIANLKRDQKQKFFEDAVRWVDASCYNREVLKIKREGSIKMFSTENVGWNMFSYKINSDIIIELRTNFGYGSAAYFLLGVKYKGIDILPYSIIINYYHVNMSDVVRCTRNYIPTRKNWIVAFDFISDLVNQSNSNPDKFIRDYILEEVKEMMVGLEAISINPKGFIEEIRWRNHQTGIVNIQSMLSEDSHKLATYPEEIPILFKVEKTMGALKFLENLNSIAKEVKEISQYIERIIELNNALRPEIISTVESINKKIEIESTRKAELTKTIENLSEQLKPYQEEISVLTIKDSTFDLKQYEATHHNYQNLKMEKLKRQTSLNEVSILINDLKSFITFLNSSLSQLSQLLKVA